LYKKICEFHQPSFFFSNFLRRTIKSSPTALILNHSFETARTVTLAVALGLVVPVSIVFVVGFSLTKRSRQMCSSAQVPDASLQEQVMWWQAGSGIPG